MTELALDAKSQGDLWKHMKKECIIRLLTEEEYRNRKTLLAELEREIEDGRYAPRPIHGFVSTPKQNGVPRFVPILSFLDVAVYFGCVKAFDESLANLAIEGTFGGWSLGGKRRENEEKQAREAFDNAVVLPAAADNDFSGLIEDPFLDWVQYVPVSTYNRAAWVGNWQQYWKLLAATFEHASETSYFVMFDVANFYDSIDLPRLERELRRYCADKTVAVEVLLYLLSTWNKAVNMYARTTKGIPMDIVGDCSRILANFYLVPFDTAMRERAVQADAQFMRFADDMVLACPNERVCRELVFFAAGELHTIGLNMNVSKVRYLSKGEFETYWGFKVLDAFVSADGLPTGLTLLRSLWDEPGYCRRETALKRSITLLAKRPELVEWRRWTYEKAFEKNDFILNLVDNQMWNLMTIADDISVAVDAVASVILSEAFTQPKLCLLRCMERLENHKDEGVRNAVARTIAALREISDPVIDFALRKTGAPETARESTG